MKRIRERRDAKRVDYICEVECEGEGAMCRNTRVTDLSTTGVFIDVMNPYAVGSVVKLKFTVRNTRIEVNGEVRYSLPKAGMGVRFLDLRADHLAAIRAQVDGQPTGPLRQPSVKAEIPVVQTPFSSNREVLRGDFAVVSLFDVMHMIEKARLTGTLQIMSTNTSGEVYFSDGLIVNAICGGNYDLDALNDFICVTEGIFEFRKTTDLFHHTITARTNTGLLRELLRAKDEAAGIFY